MFVPGDGNDLHTTTNFDNFVAEVVVVTPEIFAHLLAVRT